MSSSMSYLIDGVLHSFDRCLNLECSIENLHKQQESTLHFDFPVQPEDILFAKNLQARGCYKIIDENHELDLEKPIGEVEGSQFLCLQCEGTFPTASLVNHYKSDCLDAQGISCVGAPYCKVRGARRTIKEHEETCGLVKILCPRCESNVVRKLMGVSHNCFQNSVSRLQKIENTLMHGYYRLKKQDHCREKYDHVIGNVKKKMVSLNKRLEDSVFSLDPHV